MAAPVSAIRPAQPSIAEFTARELSRSTLTEAFRRISFIQTQILRKSQILAIEPNGMT